MIILPRHSLKALLLVVGLWAILMLRHLEALVLMRDNDRTQKKQRITPSSSSNSNNNNNTIRSLGHRKSPGRNTPFYGLPTRTITEDFRLFGIMNTKAKTKAKAKTKITKIGGYPHPTGPWQTTNSSKKLWRRGRGLLRALISIDFLAIMILWSRSFTVSLLHNKPLSPFMSGGMFGWFCFETTGQLFNRAADHYSSLYRIGRHRSRKKRVVAITILVWIYL